MQCQWELTFGAAVRIAIVSWESTIGLKVEAMICHPMGLELIVRFPEVLIQKQLDFEMLVFQ